MNLYRLKLSNERIEKYKHQREEKDVMREIRCDIEP